MGHMREAPTQEGQRMARSQQHPAAVVSEEVVALAVGAAVPQVVTDRTGSTGVRNGLLTALGTTTLGILGAAYGKRGSIWEHGGKALAGGSLAWASGVAAQHIDAGLMAKASADVQVQQAQLQAMQAAQFPPALPPTEFPPALPAPAPRTYQGLQGQLFAAGSF